MASERRVTDVVLHSAQAIGPEPIPVLRVMASTPAPNFKGEGWEQTAREFYQREGEQLAEAIFKHLPGGTVDQVIRALLLRRASLFVVPF
jgi:hypothetical protein